jgi:hypothetical protein
MPYQPFYAARNIDFAPTIHVDYAGVELPLSGATISMEVRAYPGASGDPLARDAAVPFTDGIHPDRAGWRRLTIFPVIDKEVLVDLPGQNSPAPGDAQTYVHEIKITYADDMQESLLIGEFILSAGVNA